MDMLNKRNFAVIVGNALEYYDFMLYGFFATILAPLFFPSDNPVLSLIASMGSYGVGFLARPLGGIFFGHLGDRWGRKNTLSLSLLFVTLPTLGIALLPTYNQIGMWAPLLLIVFRLVQGFCLGGEASGAMTYIIENSPSNQKDKASSWLVLSCYAGTLVGTLLGAFFTLSFMPPWGWRLTFVMGSFIALIGYYIRRQLKESPEFMAFQQKGQILKVPLKEIFKNEKMNLFYSAGVSCGVVIPFFIIFIYLNGLLTKELHFAAHSVLALNAGLMGFWILLLPVFGTLAQHYGRGLIMSMGVLGMVLLAIPLFLFIGSTPTLESVIFSQVLLSVFAMAYAAPSSALLVELFPPNQRYSGIAFGYSLGHAIFGGLTPIFLTTLTHSFGLYMAPAICLVGSGVLGSIALQKQKFIFRTSVRAT